MHWREAEKNVGTNYKNNKLEKNTQTFFQYSRSCLTRLLFRCSVSLSPLQSCVLTYIWTDVQTYMCTIPTLLYSWRSGAKRGEVSRKGDLHTYQDLLPRCYVRGQVVDYSNKQKQNRMFVSKCWHQETKCVIFCVTNLALNSVPMFLNND